nr:hypothetical protein CFP56_71631 [Quercus suber]
MSLMLTAQTTAALIGFHLTTPSSSSKALLVVLLIDQLVACLCGLTSILLSSNKPEDSKAAKIFADIGFICTALGFILMVAMLVPWYLVLIAVLLFGVICFIFLLHKFVFVLIGFKALWNELKTRRFLGVLEGFDLCGRGICGGNHYRRIPEVYCCRKASGAFAEAAKRV